LWPLNSALYPSLDLVNRQVILPADRLIRTLAERPELRGL
jgi:hypothetical protein